MSDDHGHGHDQKKPDDKKKGDDHGKKENPVMPAGARNALIWVGVAIGILMALTNYILPTTVALLCDTTGVGCRAAQRLGSDAGGGAVANSGGPSFNGGGPRVAVATPGYVPGAPRNPSECVARGGAVVPSRMYPGRSACAGFQ
ncbi:MAG: hypothetical protein P4L81_03200 [Candidatus Pacebacteria bacterium]|nr:hypothetical protein [Candidatus Paceibacterota bacterium]